MDPLARRIAAIVFIVGLSVATAQAAADEAAAAVAWRRHGAVEWRHLSGDTTALPAEVPLGSLWKLFVHAYLLDTDAHEPPYRCASKRSRDSEEQYCCEPGLSVERDEALARSCGPYFVPKRLGIDADAWRRHWRREDPAAAWLADLSRLKPETVVAPGELLAALDAIAPPTRRRLRTALLPVLLEGYGRGAWPELGTGIRFKTFSWHDDHGRPLGGGAGWLADGTPVWFAGPGASTTMLHRYARALADVLPSATATNTNDGTCVDVRFFSRYPLRAVRDDTGKPAAAGVLSGVQRLEFANGNRLVIESAHRLELRQAQGRPEIRGRFGLEEYVARVVDREGDGGKTQAARALAVAARTYLFQRGHYAAGCWFIDDDSRRQRVSPNPPSRAALAAAEFTQGLLLKTPVRFHRDKVAPGVLSWRHAVALADADVRFDAILADAYGPAAYAGVDGSTDCRRLKDAEIWLARHARRWARELHRHPGFEAPTGIAVCALPYGNPYSDQGDERIYVRDWASAQGRLTLAHEYLHFAFRYHPSGSDEAFVERLARKLEQGIQP